MAPPTIYGLAFSTCTKRVLTTLAEKGVEWNLEVVNLGKGEHKTPEFLEKQPFGVIPVYKDDDVQIYESRAIARYVADKYSGQGTELLGSTLKERALVNQWLEVEAQNYNPIVSALVAEKVFKPMFGGGEPDEEKAKPLVEKLKPILDIYEAHLSKNTYLAGDNFSLADLSHLAYTNLLVTAAGYGDLFTSRPNLNKWWNTITSRPSWQKVVALS